MRRMQSGSGSVGVFNFFGTGPIQAYSNRMDGQTYIKILSEHLLPWKEIPTLGITTLKTKLET